VHALPVARQGPARSPSRSRNVIEDIKKDARERMAKSLEALHAAFARIRTGRAHPDLLEPIRVSYYGVETPLKQLAAITVEEGRTLVVTPWERKIVGDVEKAILKSDLGITPNTAGQVIRLPLPPLTEQTRRDLTRLARHEAEQARVSLRNVRRDAVGMLRELEHEKEISQDEERRALDDVQKITDDFIARVEQALQEKEADLMTV
jgi:ribosome recycling factor